MPRRTYEDISLMAMLDKQRRAGISDNNQIIEARSIRISADDEELPPLANRIAEILGIARNKQRPKTNMLYFVMYDIESNKVRRNVAKYLLRMGCTRVQESIFLADTPREKYEKIRDDLIKVQAMYENQDSILVVPISTDMLRSMKVIGKSINLDIITQSVNTLFF